MREASNREELLLGPRKSAGEEEEGRFLWARVSFSAARMSEAEEPPLKRCSRGEESELEAQAGVLSFGGRARREGSDQPRLDAREERSGFCLSGGVDEDSIGTGRYVDDSSAELDSRAGGGGVEAVVGTGLIAFCCRVVDIHRAD
jgi:hypothetical protein